MRLLLLFLLFAAAGCTTLRGNDWATYQETRAQHKGAVLLRASNRGNLTDGTITFWENGTFECRLYESRPNGYLYYAGTWERSQDSLVLLRFHRGRPVATWTGLVRGGAVHHRVLFLEQDSARSYHFLPSTAKQERLFDAWVAR